MKLGFATLTLCFATAGCVSIPPAHLEVSDPQAALAADVEFLAKPELKGRKPKTRGSRLARRYIEARFKAYGLAPWGQERDYELPFGYGKNVVGIIPGADEKLAEEVVLLSAHYDHLGKNGDGQFCPGAADNASGVAVLLETARMLSMGPGRPKRTVAFVAFDCEEQMLLGSFAFSLREDVSASKIVAVVNVDMLGRDFMDVVEDTVFLAGTERYPRLRAQTQEMGKAAGIRVLTIGTDLIGPRSDHVAFESLDIPCLFFSTGTCRDYHKPTDTADKLDYRDIERAAKVISGTVQSLANGSKPVAEGKNYDAEELRTVSMVVAEMTKKSEQAGIRHEDLEAFQQLQKAAEHLLASGQYDEEARKKLIIEASGVLTAYLLPVEEWTKKMSAEQQKAMKETIQILQHFYLKYRREFMDGYRELVGQVLKYRPGLFRPMPDFKREVCDIAGNDIHVKETGTNTYALNALVNSIEVKMHKGTWKNPLKPISGGEIRAEIHGIDCEGTREQLVDACLLRLRRHQDDAVRTENLRKVLARVTGIEPGENTRQLITERVKSGGFADETEWVVYCMLSENPDVACAAMTLGKEMNQDRIIEAACQALANRHLRPDVRVSAIELASKNNANEGALLALCDILDDSNLAYRLQDVAPFRPGYPFADRVEVKMMRLMMETYYAQQATKTIGDFAYETLKTATKKDFGREPGDWRKWVLQHASAGRSS